MITLPSPLENRKVKRRGCTVKVVNKIRKMEVFNKLSLKEDFIYYT